MPRTTLPPQTKQTTIRKREDEVKIRQALKRREEQRKKEREKLFGPFKKEEPKTAPASESKEIKEAAKPEEQIKQEKKQLGKTPKKLNTKTAPKEDVFVKLKEITRGVKKNKSQKSKNAKK